MSLVGPSGSGKSSLLRVAMGLQKPFAGSVDLERPKSDIGILFQDDALLPWRTARQNVSLGLRFRGMSKHDALTKATNGSRVSASKVWKTVIRAASPAASASAWRSRRCSRSSLSSF